MHATVSHPAVEAAPILGRRSWSLLILLCVAQFMVIVDMTVVNVALPSIGKALRFASAADLQWVVTAYVLFSGGLVLLGGRVADLLGGRRVFLAGLLLFTAASFASGLAPTPLALIIARGAQGLGAALLTPAALSLITTAYTGSQRATGLAAWGVIGGAGAAAGVLLGGAITSWLGWHWVFFINVPIGLGAAALTARLVPATPAAGGRLRDLDVGGAVLVIAALVLLVYTVEDTATYGWGSAHTLIALGLSVSLLALFVAVERRVTRPLIAPSIWRARSLVGGAAAMLAATGVMGGAFFLNSLYLQRVLGASPVQAGLAFFPFAAVIVLAAHISSHLLSRFGVRVVLTLGLAIAAGGALWLARVPDHATYWGNVLPGFLALGLGLGLSFVAVMIAAMAGVGSAHAGLASGVMSTAHEIGAALGVALLSAIATAASADGAFVPGYRAGLLAAAVIAGLVAVIALLVAPSVRPSGAAHMGPHGA